MGIYLGFDPGGINAFGWAVLSGDAFPLQLKGCGVAVHAQSAFQAAINCAGNNIDGVGIDAPLFWNSAGDRAADRLLRTAIARLGSHSATVGSVNSLRGACLIQGILVALLCQKHLGQISITESHPKALLWLLGKANQSRRPEAISFEDLYDFVFSENQRQITEHERDAAIGALTAFAAMSKVSGWQDLYASEIDPISPLSPPPEYWMPKL